MSLLRLRVRSDDLLKAPAGKILALFCFHLADFGEKRLSPHRIPLLAVYLSKLLDRCLVSRLQPDG
jgi:hypothetical protein